MSRLSFTVFKPAGRPNFVVQWLDPRSGRKKTRTTKQARRREAERAAAKILAEVELNIFEKYRPTNWSEFRELYELKTLPSKRPGTIRHAVSSLNRIEKIIKPATVDAITKADISRFEAQLRADGLAPYSIRRHLTCLKTLLNFAESEEIIDRAPKVKMPGDLVPSKGRPITSEEFERMLMVAPAVVGQARAAEWSHLLIGLWLSGLRLSEAHALHWTDDSGGFALDFTRERPMFWIRAFAEKGKRDRMLPMTPDFARFIEETPEAGREGHVFYPSTADRRFRLTAGTTGRVISEIGARANVCVGAGRLGAIKYASAHDFRRAFGQRWSERVSPRILQVLMRHESSITTEKFYLSRIDEVAVDDVWSHQEKASEMAARLLEIANN